MQDYYRIPALVLTLLLLPAFAYLYHRYRNTRTLLWLLGYLFAAVRMTQLLLSEYRGGKSQLPAWILAIGVISAQTSSALFLASLSPQRVYLFRIRLLYLFIVPIIAIALLTESTLLGLTPPLVLTWAFPLLGAIAAAAALQWGWDNGAAPRWYGAGVCAAASLAVLWVYYARGPVQSLHTLDSAIHFVTALLVLVVFRRFSPGVLLTVTGFLVWATMVFGAPPTALLLSATDLHWVRAIVMAKVVAAIGMILLTLEEELDAKRAAQERERQMRLQMEIYTELVRPCHNVLEFDGQAAEICRQIVRHSRFAQAGLLLLDSFGRFRLTGTAGFEPALKKTLGALAEKIPATGFLAPGTAPLAAESGTTVQLDLKPWLQPGDDLIRLHFTGVYAIPLASRSVCTGALLLASPRSAGRKPATLLAEDLLPLEIFAARLESARSQTIMLEKLISTEKFASVGQLAESVTHQLNNPLTVILGYAALLEGGASAGSEESRFIAAILSQTRQMKTILESLTRVSASQHEQGAAVSIADLLADLEHLHHTDFLRHAIDFRMTVAADLPLARGHAQQLRQAIQHCLQYGVHAVEAGGGDSTNRIILMEASCEGQRVQIMMSHSGPGFSDPAHAFDPLADQNNLAESRTLGLSLCSSILRANNGHASAINLEPRGAAIILELQVA